MRRHNTDKMAAPNDSIPPSRRALTLRLEWKRFPSHLVVDSSEEYRFIIRFLSLSSWSHT